MPDPGIFTDGNTPTATQWQSFQDWLAQENLPLKPTVRCCATGNVTIANPGGAVFDGVTMSNGEDILLPSQTTGAEGGLYVFHGSAVAMTRRTDADADVELKCGTELYIREGAVFGGARARLRTVGYRVGIDTPLWDFSRFLPDITEPSPTTNKLYSVATGVLKWAGKRLALIATTLSNSQYVKTDGSGNLVSAAAIPEADVTGLVSDLAAKAPLASPTFSGTVTLGSGVNVAANTGTGSQIGTATNQKIAFHGATAVAQRAGAAQATVAATASTQTTPYGYTTQAQADAIVTLLNEIQATLVEKGIFKGSA